MVRRGEQSLAKHVPQEVRRFQTGPSRKSFAVGAISVLVGLLTISDLWFCDTKPLAGAKSPLESTSIVTAESAPYDKSCIHGQLQSAVAMGSIAVVLALGRLFYKTHLPSCHSAERRHGMRIH